MTKNQIALRKVLGPADAPAATVKGSDGEAEAEKKPDGEGEPDGDEATTTRRSPRRTRPRASRTRREEDRGVEDAGRGQADDPEPAKRVTAAPAKAEATEKKVRADVDKWVSEGASPRSGAITTWRCTARAGPAHRAPPGARCTPPPRSASRAARWAPKVEVPPARSAGRGREAGLAGGAVRGGGAGRAGHPLQQEELRNTTTWPLPSRSHWISTPRARM